MRTRTYDYEHVHRLYAYGVTVDEIAERIGSARSTVWRILNGHKVASGTHAKRVDREQLLALWQQGLTLTEIGIQLGCSASTVTLLVKQHNLPPREPIRKMPLDDPTPEEIAERARECRERHFAERRKEPACSTHSKVSKWRQGICQPRGLA
jgi:DNA-binding CsgD family transcriptional regulator